MRRKKTMDRWRKDNLMELLHEMIRKCLKIMHSKRVIRMASKKFAALIEKGNVNAAINLLLKSMRNGILPLNNETSKYIFAHSLLGNQSCKHCGKYRHLPQFAWRQF